jgi:protein-serine/threonine kinase
LPAISSLCSLSISAPPLLELSFLRPPSLLPPYFAPRPPDIMLNALSASVVNLSFADEDWPADCATHYRAASVGNSWGVTSIGRGFDWKPREREVIAEATDDGYDTSKLFFAPSPDLSNSDPDPFLLHTPPVVKRTADPPSPRMSHSSSPAISRRSSFGSNAAVNRATDPLSYSPIQSPLPSRPLTPVSGRTSPDTSSVNFSRRNSRASSCRSRPRRRSSQQRVSLIAGRVSIAQVEPPSPPPVTTRLVRSNSAASFLSVASVGAPTPNSEPNAFLTERSISEFVIEREIGRGAYGLVKRAREMQLDGTCGVRSFLSLQVSKLDPANF